jgi:hypothetical protein
VKATRATTDPRDVLLRRLVEALDEYGRHKSACTIWAGRWRVIDPKKKCSCGLAAALANARAATREE